MGSIIASMLQNRTPRGDLSTTYALAIAQTIVVAVVIAIGAIPRGGAPLTAYIVALVSGILTLVAHRLPVTALMLSVVMVIVYYMLDLPPIGVAVPILGPVYLASRAGYGLVAAGSALTLVTLSAVFRTIEAGESSALIAYDTVTNLALVAATVAVAALQRARDRAELQQRRLTEVERISAQRESDTQRVQIARHLHDSLGHRLALVAVYAGVAGEADDDSRRAEALAEVQEGVRAALDELREAVRTIRSGSGESSLEGVDGALESAVSALRAAGFAVDAEIDGEVDAVPLAVRVGAVRILQEAVTNILKHARADHAKIRVWVEPDVLRLRVADDGAVQSFERGQGIRGMEERARELGGSLSIADRTDGFVLEAILPWTGTS
jgi:signal transduction histidine kinase